MRIRTLVTGAILALSACSEPPTAVNVEPQLSVDAAVAAPITFHEIDMSGFPDRNTAKVSLVTDAGDGALLLTYQALGDTARQVLVRTDGSTETVLAPDGTPRVFTARINDHGDVAGNYGDGWAPTGFLRMGGTTTSFSAPGGGINAIGGVNSAGMVAGTYRNDDLGNFNAFAWTPTGGMVAIPFLGTYPATGLINQYVGGVNDQGDVVGSQWRSEYIPGTGIVNSYRAWIWSAAGGTRDLGDWSAPNGVAVAAINEAGTIVGTRTATPPCREALLTSEAGPLTPLANPFAGCFTSASDINEAHVIVGLSRDPDVAQIKGVVWMSDGTTQVLPVPPDATSTLASSVSNSGLVGGAYYGGGQYHPGYWILTLDPQTKDDCMDGGWAGYGFKNQGQCVRFIETGADSR